MLPRGYGKSFLPPAVQAFAFIGAPLADWAGRLPAAAIDAGYHAFYWIQMIVVLAFPAGIGAAIARMVV